MCIGRGIDRFNSSHLETDDGGAVRGEAVDDLLVPAESIGPVWLSVGVVEVLTSGAVEDGVLGWVDLVGEISTSDGLICA